MKQQLEEIIGAAILGALVFALLTAPNWVPPSRSNPTRFRLNKWSPSSTYDSTTQTPPSCSTVPN